jgi:hypothetical protein
MRSGWLMMGLAAAAPAAAGPVLTGRIGAAGDPDIVTVFDGSRGGDIAPSARLGGGNTGLGSVAGLHYDPVRGEIYVSDFSAQRVAVFGANAAGDAAPLRTLTAPDMGQPRELLLSPGTGELHVITRLCCISTYAATSAGATTALRRIDGANTQLDNPSGFAYSAAADAFLVADSAGDFEHRTGEILRFPRSANGNAFPSGWIGGQSTGLGNGVLRVAVDDARGEIYALAYTLGATFGDPNTGAIVTFSLFANGDATPLRRIAGPATQLRNIMGFAYDQASGEFIVAANNWSNALQPTLLFFARNANGDVAPARVISGDATGMAPGSGWTAVSALNGSAIFASGFE